MNTYNNNKHLTGKEEKLSPVQSFNSNSTVFQMNNNNINNIDLEAGLDSPATISRTTPVKNGDDSNSISSATLVHPSNSYLAFRIRHFSPAWFSAVMGLGVSSAILYSFPFPMRVFVSLVWLFGVSTFCFSLFA